MSIRAISHFSVYVKDQDEALHWYQDKLGFQVCDDKHDAVSGFRWLTIAPKGNPSTQLVLMSCQNSEERKRVGKNSLCVLISNDCVGDCNLFETRGVTVTQSPAVVPWGISAVLQDLYGNSYNLVQLGSG